MGTTSLGEWIREIFTTFADYANPWVIVKHYQEAVILRCGKYNRTLPPGYWIKWPFLEYVYEVNVKCDTMSVEPVTITTIDGKSITIGLILDFEIIDSKKFMLENNDSYTNMKDLARGEMSDYLEDVNWENIKKKTTKNALMRLISKRFQDMGIKLNDLKFTDKVENRAFRLFGNGPSQSNAIYS